MGAIIGALIICGVWYFIEKLIDEKKEKEEFQRRQREELNRIIEADNKRKEEENNIKNVNIVLVFFINLNLSYKQVNYIM